jgi:hypothetical protein
MLLLMRRILRPKLHGEMNLTELYNAQMGVAEGKKYHGPVIVQINHTCFSQSRKQIEMSVNCATMK